MGWEGHAWADPPCTREGIGSHIRDSAYSPHVLLLRARFFEPPLGPPITHAFGLKVSLSLPLDSQPHIGRISIHPTASSVLGTRCWPTAGS